VRGAGPGIEHLKRKAARVEAALIRGLQTMAALKSTHQEPVVTIYLLKPRFQSLLRPATAALHAAGVTANQVTLAACAVSVLLGLGLFMALPAGSGVHPALALVPAWMLLRMAFNAADGMLARDFGQASRLGALLNELTDVLSDAALYLPLALLAPLQPVWVGAFIVLAGLSEFAGALGPVVGASRRYDGPMGKSDRALAVGAIALWAAVAPLPDLCWLLMPLLVFLTAWTVVHRMQRALAEGAA
jgi:CDP-diacylglycerol--glycerol-3-phosphate 3-phosphatidyltransferase